MKVGTLVDVSGPGAELRYVTAHFRDLQGLRMAPFWAALLVLIQFETHNLASRGHLAWAAISLTGLQFGWLHLSGHWYERRYGIVKEPEPPVHSGLISIMHPDPRPTRASNRYYGYHSGYSAVLFLIWALILLPEVFLGRHGPANDFVLLVTAFLVVPRCFYPVTEDRSVILRRSLAVSALVAIIGIYLYAHLRLWAWMTTQFGVLLALDLYDHWLFNHLLGSGFVEEIHE